MRDLEMEFSSLASKRRAMEICALLTKSIRDFFTTSGYLEVETPVISDFILPEANIEPIQCAANGLLLPSPETFMKILVAAGYEKIFQICKCFRAGERGSRHRPEFTMLEWYRGGADYLSLMEECEELIGFCAARLRHSDFLPFAGRTINIKRPFLRIGMVEAFEKFSSQSLACAVGENRFDETFALEVEPRIPKDRAVFLHDYPLAAGGFAKQKTEDSFFIERFEMYIGGLEIANACSEIDDAKENERRIVQAMQERSNAGKPVHPLPPSFLQYCERMPPCAGAALGVDRLSMIFADASDIGDVLAFG